MDIEITIIQTKNNYFFERPKKMGMFLIQNCIASALMCGGYFHIYP